MKPQDTQLKQAGSHITSTSTGLLIGLNTYRAAVLALLFAGAILLGTSGASAATITVINTNDTGPGSLRQALVDANDGDKINFALSLNGHKIKLTSGQLNVNKDIIISGPGANHLAVNGNAQSRVFYVNPGKTVTIDRLTVANGYSDSGPGGIWNDSASLTVSNCTISRNSGGGISNDGSATVRNCVINGNSGGGISNGGSTTVRNCVISGNFGGGIVNSGGSATLTITNSILAGNSGGGIFNYAFNGSATVTLTDCTVSGNSASYGGGIFTEGFNGGVTLTISNSTLSGNSAGVSGGGIYSVAGGGNSGYSTVTVSNSTISGNSAGDGGGIYNVAGNRSGAEVAISNSTVSGNSATGNGGGIYNSQQGGGAELELGSNILNGGSSGENIFNVGGTVTSHGYNLSSDNGSGYLTGPGDQINTNPLLGPLQNNGGPTFTHALLPGSPAINTGGANFTPPPLYDQRGPGFDRVVNGRIDVGFFEIQPAHTPTNAYSNGNGDAAADTYVYTQASPIAEE